MFFVYQTVSLETTDLSCLMFLIAVMHYVHIEIEMMSWRSAKDENGCDREFNDDVGMLTNTVGMPIQPSTLQLRIFLHYNV